MVNIYCGFNPFSFKILSSILRDLDTFLWFKSKIIECILNLNNGIFERRVLNKLFQGKQRSSKRKPQGLDCSKCRWTVSIQKLKILILSNSLREDHCQQLRFQINTAWASLIVKMPFSIYNYIYMFSYFPLTVYWGFHFYLPFD